MSKKQDEQTEPPEVVGKLLQKCLDTLEATKKQFHLYTHAYQEIENLFDQAKACIDNGSLTLEEAQQVIYQGIHFHYQVRLTPVQDHLVGLIEQIKAERLRIYDLFVNKENERPE